MLKNKKKIILHLKRSILSSQQEKKNNINKLGYLNNKKFLYTRFFFLYNQSLVTIISSNYDMPIFCCFLFCSLYYKY